LIGDALTLEGVAVSAGFAATISIYMMSIHRRDYVKLGRACQVSIILFAASSTRDIRDWSMK